jgi:HCOMODA/2-hydroxy-3-carboxy-muconic semialdehyde decarboxylase
MKRRDFMGRSLLAVVGASFARAAQAGQPAAAAPPAPKLIEDLVAAYRIIAQQGVVDAYGHVSARHDRDSGRFYMARAVAPALVTADDLIEYDLDSNPVNAKGRAQFAERFIHGEIYKVRPDVKAVVHAHSPSLVAFGVSTVPLTPVYHMAGFIGDGLPIFDIRDDAGITNMLVNDGRKGHALAAVLANRPAVLMRGHGVVVVGASLPFAVGRSVYLELNAKIQAQALAMGGKLAYLDSAEAQTVVDTGETGGYERPWELWVREVSKK